MSDGPTTGGINKSAKKGDGLNPLVKLALEFGPLAIFFLANAYGDKWFGVTPDRRIFVATGVFIAATLLALAAMWLLTRKIALMPLVSAVVVTVFGGLTLALDDALFIKLKPSIVNTMFGCILLGGLAYGKSFLSVLLDSVMQLDAEGWRKLTFRWALFFFFLAAINEVVWRTQTTDFWVAFKVWGVMPITIAFALAQTPLILKHELKDENAP
ncbi:MAG: septation protein A [Bosea sp. (in: a-proteobacteria)]